MKFLTKERLGDLFSIACFVEIFLFLIQAKTFEAMVILLLMKIYDELRNSIFIKLGDSNV